MTDIAPVSLLDMIRRRADVEPDAPAVLAPDGRLTYRELVGSAAVLAGRLAAEGVGKGDHVALGDEKSVVVVAAMIGVWQLGAAFVVVDEETAAPRLADLFKVARPKAVVARGAFGERISALGVPVVDPAVATAARPVSAYRDLPSRWSSGRGIPLDSVAYLVLTSGSTGTPKAVVVEHGHLGSYLAAVLDRIRVTTPAVFATVGPLWTDLGYTAVFGALAAGCAIRLVGAASSVSPAALTAEFGDCPVDVLKITPSHLAALLAVEGGGAVILPRQVLILGGERLPWALVEQVRTLAPGLRLVNHYGPAECTIGVAAGPVPIDHLVGTNTVPVGPPLAGSRLFVVDDKGDLAPTGATGEIYVSGPTVARGYLGDTEATAARFRRINVNGSVHSCYRTGDLARRLDGDLVELIGRVDRQLKVRGFRVEPGEIEHALMADSRIRTAHAFAVEDDDDSVAVAVALTTDDLSLTEADVRRALGQRLAPAALPQWILVLADLPRTAAGKVDEAALVSLARRSRGPVVTAAGSGSPGFTSPSERLVCMLWSELLGRPVGPHESLVSLGANSIAAIRFLARLHAACGVEIPLHMVFERPTTAELAALVDQAATSSGLVRTSSAG